jgi:hypothetical protein
MASGLLWGGQTPLSLDLIAKVAERIEDMATRNMEPRKTRSTQRPEGKK